MADKVTPCATSDASDAAAAAPPSAATYDVIIVGGGPAGLTAGLYCSRARLTTALLERGPVGGQIASTDIVENFLGFPDAPAGRDLAQVWERHATQFGLELKPFTTVYGVTKADDGTWVVHCDEGDLKTKAAIIATGSAPKKLGVPGENEFAGRGVSYCATCDGAFFKDKRIVVVGGGDSAVEEGTFLTRFASRVSIVHRRDKLRAEPIVAERALANDKIEFIFNAVLKEIRGEARVKSVLIAGTVQDREWEVETDGVFIYVGNNPNTHFVSHVVALDEMGFVTTDNHLATSEKGLFAAGDCRAGVYKQLIIAAGEGAVAALSAQHYVERLG